MLLDISDLLILGLASSFKGLTNGLQPIVGPLGTLPLKLCFKEVRRQVAMMQRKLIFGQSEYYFAK